MDDISPTPFVNPLNCRFGIVLYCLHTVSKDFSPTEILIEFVFLESV